MATLLDHPVRVNNHREYRDGWMGGHDTFLPLLDGVVRLSHSIQR